VRSNGYLHGVEVRSDSAMLARLCQYFRHRTIAIAAQAVEAQNEFDTGGHAKACTARTGKKNKHTRLATARRVTTGVISHAQRWIDVITASAAANLLDRTTGSSHHHHRNTGR
jgi:hypothetical protein